MSWSKMGLIFMSSLVAGFILLSPIGETGQRAASVSAGTKPVAVPAETVNVEPRSTCYFKQFELANLSGIATVQKIRICQ